MELHQRNTLVNSTEMNCVAVSESERNRVQIWSITALVRSERKAKPMTDLDLNGAGTFVVVAQAGNRTSSRSSDKADARTGILTGENHDSQFSVKSVQRNKNLQRMHRETRG